MKELQLGEALNDPLVERFWNIIQHLNPNAKPGARGGAGALHPVVLPRPGTRYPGLALSDTRDYSKALNDEIMTEAATKATPGECAAGWLAAWMGGWVGG